MHSFAAQYAPLQPPPAGPPLPSHLTNRLRWGRLALVFAGCALLALAITNMATAPNRAASAPASAIDPAARAASTPIDDAPAANTPDPLTAEDSPPELATPTHDARPEHMRSGADNGSSNRNSSRRLRRAAAGGSALGAGVNAGAAHAKPRESVRGSGRSDTSLPKTGAPAWFAAVLGLLLVGTGILLQMNAVRIGATAGLYQRGPLLRAETALPAAYRLFCAITGLLCGICSQCLPSLAAYCRSTRARLTAAPRSSDFVNVRRSR